MNLLRGSIFIGTVVLLFILLDFSFSTAVHVTECQHEGSPSLHLTCGTGTIRITNGICVKLSSCDSFDSYLESECEDSDYTERCGPYCATTGQLCTITASCSGGSTCPGDYTYAYADYECIQDDETFTSSTTSERSLTSNPGLDSVEDHVTTKPPITAIEQRKNSLFKLVHTGRCLKNHVIKVKPGVTSVKCGSECNKLDECVSFNIGSGVCQLNSQLVGDHDVTADDLEDSEGSKYYEKVEKK